MPADLHLSMLGGFSVAVAGQRVDDTRVLAFRLRSLQKMILVCRIRALISQPIVGARPHISEPKPNQTTPTRKIRRAGSGPPRRVVAVDHRATEEVLAPLGAVEI